MALERVLLVAQLAGLVLALVVARRALQDFHVARAPTLRRFGIGFGLLALAQAAAMGLGLATVRAATIPLGRFDLFDLFFWTYYLAELVGFLAIFTSFGRHPFRWTPVVAPGLLLVSGILLQFAVLVVLFFVVLHAGLNHIARARPGSLRTAVGFFALLVGHFLFLFDWAPLAPRNLWGELAALAGYAILTWAVVAKPSGSS